MLIGHLRLDVPVANELVDIMHADNCVGIEIHPKHLKLDPSDPDVYTVAWPSPRANVTVMVRPDGSTTVSSEPSCSIHENTLRRI